MTQMDGLHGDSVTTKNARSPHIAVTRLKFIARQLADSALDLLFPPRCISCNRAGSLLCQDCQAALTPVAPVVHITGPLREHRATAVFEGAIRESLHALKYENQQRMALALGSRLYDEYKRAAWTATVITAAPLHANRQRTRGYNQAGLLAQNLAQRAGIPYIPDLLQRVRDTQSQVGLTMRERQANVADAFIADSRRTKAQHIVIVDDVYTTGATLRACADALRQAGAAEVWGLTVAAAPHDQDVPSAS
ncbi:MAG: ComF family protein [Anaerolineae bacterium]|nr:ComF family protein [Anaerolineae bacterium]